MMIGITTAGERVDKLGNDSHCYRLYQHGTQVASGEIPDPTFYFAWWEPSAGALANHRSPDVWHEANPGFGDLNSEADFASTLLRTSESEFRTKRTNVWVTATYSALPFGAWDALAAPAHEPPEGTSYVLAFDGSWRGDCTAIVAATIEPKPHLSVVALWENPKSDTDWRIPIAEVEQTIREFAHEHQTLEVVCDPYRWQRSMAVLTDEGLPLVEFPTNSVERMVKAWSRFYDAVLDGTFSHSGDKGLARHVENMRLKVDARGARPVKESKVSERHIDLGICAVLAYARAAHYGEQGEQSTSDFFSVTLSG
jgi:phage terminase large subunit-like protein